MVYYVSTIEFSDHAERKIKQRNLSKKYIRDTIIRPDYVFETHGARYIAYKKIKRLYLAVVYIKEDGRTIIITAHWEKTFDIINKEQILRRII